MSIKIYNAFIWKQKLRLLHKYLFQLREEYMQYCIQTVKENSRYIPVSDAGNGLTLFDIIDEVRKRTKSPLIHPFNFSASAVVIPYNKILIVQYFGLPSEIWEKIMPEDLLRDFHYQNQTDAYFDYEEITDVKELLRLKRDWAYRERVWDNIYKKYQTPAEVGFTFELFSDSAAYEVARKVLEDLKVF